MTNFRQVIVVVDIDAKLDFLQLRASRPLISLMFGNVVSEFPERDDFADWRVRRWCNLDKIETDALRLAQSIRQFHDTELFAGGS